VQQFADFMQLGAAWQAKAREIGWRSQVYSIDQFDAPGFRHHSFPALVRFFCSVSIAEFNGHPTSVLHNASSLALPIPKYR